jgi:putative transposase
MRSFPRNRCHTPAFHGAGHFVSAVGRDETAIREYIRNQEVEDKRLEQLKM